MVYNPVSEGRLYNAVPEGRLYTPQTMIAYILLTQGQDSLYIYQGHLEIYCGII